MGKKSRKKKLRKLANIVPDQIPTPSRITEFRAEFSGPIPHPSILQQYNAVVPGAAERILQMAERQAAHRMDLERSVIASDVKKSERGQWLGIAIAIIGLLVALVLGLTDHDSASGIIGGVTVVSLVSVFVYGRHQKQKEREHIRTQRIES